MCGTPDILLYCLKLFNFSECQNFYLQLSICSLLQLFLISQKKKGIKTYMSNSSFPQSYYATQRYKTINERGYMY